MTFDDIRAEGTGIRVHGNGFIQIDLPNARRLHVWGHPAIPRQVVSTQIHDHRFDFYSFVLRGTMVNVVYRVRTIDHQEPSHTVYTPQARAGEDTVLVPYGPPVKLYPSKAEAILAGDSYRMRAGEVHETFVNQPTATLMLKGDVGEMPVRVFCPVGKKPDNDFVRHEVMGEDDLWQIVRDVFA
ncbi:MAG: hypothetical protein EOS07_22155 [Mesorhizobium sp.]|nr:MAG: hypothetical protein EOS07_22155 [Mesorhizobium sp.]